MRSIFFVFLFFIFSLAIVSQNLVPNGGFEEYDICPEELSDGKNDVWELAPKYWYQPHCGTSSLSICLRTTI